MTILERINEIQTSNISCHPSREEEIKTRLCIYALAEEIMRLSTQIKETGYAEQRNKDG